MYPFPEGGRNAVTSQHAHARDCADAEDSLRPHNDNDNDRCVPSGHSRYRHTGEAACREDGPLRRTAAIAPVIAAATVHRLRKHTQAVEPQNEGTPTCDTVSSLGAGGGIVTVRHRRRTVTVRFEPVPLAQRTQMWDFALLSSKHDTLWKHSAMPHTSPGRRVLHGGGGRLLVCCSVVAAVGVVL